jgi:glycosyltransferase involved in cell wall biosynthesis
MNLLFVHNEYGKFSGEEAVFYSQIEAVKKTENKVFTYVISSTNTPNNIFSMIQALFCGVFSFKQFYKILRLVKLNKIEVAHFHNIYPWLSISSLIAAKLGGAKIVLTLHNFKHICPSSTLSHNGGIYLRSLDKGGYVTVLDNVQGNIFKSIGYYFRFLSERLFKFENIVDKFIFVSEMQCDVYKKYNTKIVNKSVVIPNFLTLDQINLIQSHKSEDSGRINIGFVGRLCQDKGFDLFMDIARKLNKYNFYAFGPISSAIKDLPVNLTIKGDLSQSDLFTEYSKLNILIIPSKNYETFSLAALEALTAGVDVIVTEMIGISSYADKFHSLYVIDKSSDIYSIVERIISKVKVKDKETKQREVNYMFTEKGYLEMILKVYGEL